MNWWYHVKINEASDKNFRKRLLGEHRKRGSPPECKVYSSQAPTSAVSYYFSPVAAEHYSLLIALWQGYKCAPPADVEHMEVVCD
jgi:hypothetical protein